MEKNFTVGLTLTFAVCCVTPLAFAVEKTKALALPTHSTVKTTPQVTSIEGVITSVDVRSSVPSLKLTQTNGQLLVIQIDRPTTTVWKDAHPVSLIQLAMGQKAKIRYTTKNGKQVANSVEIL